MRWWDCNRRTWGAAGGRRAGKIARGREGEMTAGTTGRKTESAEEKVESMRRRERMREENWEVYSIEEEEIWVLLLGNQLVRHLPLVFVFLVPKNIKQL